MKRIAGFVLLIVVLIPNAARAQAPPVGPLLLILPATPRTAALGNAWVAGRDQDVLFYNPAQLIGARQGLDLSITKHGPKGTSTTLGSIYAAGKWSLTLGWGVQFADFSVNPDRPYPYSSDVLVDTGSASGNSALFAVGGAIVYKGFRFGGTGKYATDRIAPIRQSAFVADIGVARNIVGGVGGVSVQNLGSSDTVRLPKQLLMGWSTTKVAGPVDVGVFTQLTVRDGWTAPAGGLEIGYGWIEGYYVSVRVGARRPDSDPAHPFTFGAAMTADRLTIEYGVQFFEGGRTANGVTVRWR